MQIPLRVGNLDAVLVKEVPHPQQHHVLDVRTAVHRVLDPDADLEVHGTVPESLQKTRRGGIGQYPLHAVGGLLAQLDGPVHVAVVVHADRDLQAHVLVAVRPVLDAVGDQLLVRHQVLDAVTRDHRDIARPQGFDPAVLPADVQRVAGLDGLVAQQDEASHEVREDLLQAESQADADGPAEDHEGGEVDADRAEREQEGADDDDDLEDLGDQHLGRSRDPGTGVDARLDHADDQQRQPQEDGDGDDRGHHVEDTDLGFSQAELLCIQESHQGDQPAEHVQGRDAPDEGGDAAADGRVGDDRGAQADDGPGQGQDDGHLDQRIGVAEGHIQAHEGAEPHQQQDRHGEPVQHAGEKGLDTDGLEGFEFGQLPVDPLRTHEGDEEACADDHCLDEVVQVQDMLIHPAEQALEYPDQALRVQYVLNE